MNIQIIYYGTKKDYGKEYNYEYSPLDRPKSLDMFDINIIDLSSRDLWKYNNYDYIGAYSELMINAIRDFDSLKLLLTQSRGAKNIIVLPQNIYYSWDYNNINHTYKKNIVLKDIIPAMINLIIIHLIPSKFKGPIELLYENTSTNFFDTKYVAAFSFLNAASQLTSCLGSNNATTICSMNCIITSLDLNN